MATQLSNIEMPVYANPDNFDRNSGNWLERIVFNHRGLVVLACLLMTGFLGWHALQLPVNASFDKMIPQSHPYIKNYFEHRNSLRGLGNSIRISVENTQGTIYNQEYLLNLQKINDAVFLLPGVDRGFMRGLWTPSLRWQEVTEEGYSGGPVMPHWNGGVEGSVEAIEQLKINVKRSGIVGEFVGNDLKSSIIFAPLIDINTETGEPLDYAKLGKSLAEKLKPLETATTKIHIVGFAKLVSDLIDGLYDVMNFFAASALIAALCVFFYTRCIRSTLLLVFAAFLGVVWLLGLLHLFGYVLDPYSILVPFLIFAVGLSHGAQKMNGIMQDVGRGTHKYVAARYTFRRLFMAGLTALLTNVVGFAVLAIIDIPAIREMALTTSLGVSVLIFTKLMLIPVMLSYIGVSKKAAARSLHDDASTGGMTGIRNWLADLTLPRRARVAVGLAAAFAAAALMVGHYIQFGDLEPGAPELRTNSRYNRDNAYISSHYQVSMDQFVVMLKTPPNECGRFHALEEMDRLGRTLRETQGVQSVFSLADGVRIAASGNMEGNPKWITIPRNNASREMASQQFSTGRPDLVDRNCVVVPIIAYLTDHKAATLDRVVNLVDEYASKHNVPERQFMLAAGNAGIEAITNIVVRQSFWTMHFVLYGAVILLCFITFRSWRAVLVALIPLVITSLLCEALMVLLGIGIKVATLPVIAVGVGVGVDYALYLLSIQLALQRRGVPLREAYLQSLDFTGKIVALVGLTMAAGVITWIWSPIKFQADMGILLTFMFLWNMLGALMLIPALSHFLLRTDADRQHGAGDVPISTPDQVALNV